jgi:hypothetical protein
MFLVLTLVLPRIVASHSPRVHRGACRQSLPLSLWNCCDYNGGILRPGPAGRSHPGDPNSLGVDAHERLITRYGLTLLRFLWTAVCKRLADWEKNFRKSGCTNTQIINSNRVTEYSRGNEIAIE